MRIQTRVFLTILLSSLLLVAVLFWLMQWSIERGLIDYVNARQKAEFADLAFVLERSYTEDRWQQYRDNPRQFDDLVRPRGQQGDTGPPRRRPVDQTPRRPGEFPVSPNARPGPPPKRVAPPRSPGEITLVDANKRIVAGPRQPFDASTSIPLQVEGELVGWLLLPRTDRLTRDYDLEFQSSQQEALLAIAIVVLGLAAAFAFLLSPSIVKPLKLLAAATNQLAGKNFSVNLPVTRSDELGELSRDINELAQTLAKGEASRQRWLADTSHELRTPVAIIRGELEAMLDGVRPLAVDNLESLRHEVLRLQQLIDDLADLANADLGSLRYQKLPIDLGTLLRDSESHYRHLCEEAGLSLDVDLPDTPVTLFADQQRIEQLMHNLVANSAKYTDAPGRVRILLTTSGEGVTLTVEDTVPGVPAADLPHIFDHLYRVESSRNRNTGGAGLGLAIVSRIVDAHGGEVTAGTSELGGLKILIQFPLET